MALFSISVGQTKIFTGADCLSGGTSLSNCDIICTSFIKGVNGDSIDLTLGTSTGYTNYALYINENGTLFTPLVLPYSFILNNSAEIKIVAGADNINIPQIVLNANNTTQVITDSITFSGYSNCPQI